jgi:protein O-GlcNAc transferase
MPQIPPIIQKAVALHQAGKLQEAEQLYRQVLKTNPRDPSVIHLLGVIAHQTGNHNQAANLINQAIAIYPRGAEMYVNLGSVLMSLHRYAEVEVAQRKALSLDFNLPEAHQNLIQSMLAQSRPDDALAAVSTAIKQWPQDPRFQVDLARALRDKGQIDQPIKILAEVTQRSPANAAAWCNLSDLVLKRSRPTDAEHAARRAVALAPTMSEAYTNLGNALHAQANHEPAVAAHRQCLHLKDHDAIAHSNLLLGLHYDTLNSPQQIFQDHLAWDRQHAKPLRQSITHSNSRDSGRKLRIGYVSPDFRAHAVANFFEPLLSHHDRSKFFIACYSNCPAPDAVTARIASAADLFRDINAIDDAQAADLIRNDCIDILVDLAGHTARNRLLCFARKPVPIQITYLGYPDTTGLSTIDARFTDALADPPHTDAFHAESLIRLPAPFLCYQPPADAPSPAPPPVLANSHITFGSFNNFTKLNPQTIQLWAQLLKAVPTARLLLKADALADPAVAESARSAFAAHGIPPERLTLTGFVPTIAANLDFYRNIDIALDPSPYNGTTTTCEALLMGVPVVTLAGQTHCSRVGVSLLTSIELTSLIATNAQDYVNRAAALASDVNQLTNLRTELRPRFLKSPLTDATRLTINIEWAYHALFSQWCQK